MNITSERHLKCATRVIDFSLWSKTSTDEPGPNLQLRTNHAPGGFYNHLLNLMDDDCKRLLSVTYLSLYVINT